MFNYSRLDWDSIILSFNKKEFNEHGKKMCFVFPIATTIQTLFAPSSTLVRDN